MFYKLGDKERSKESAYVLVAFRFLARPFVSFVSHIARRGAAMGIDYAETWSCYKGGDVHCGRCGTCVERREALAEAGVKDTTVYEE